MRDLINIVEDAWHGTSHRFDRFSTEFLGSGEGFNTFGWGLYFTSKRQIADFYRHKLSRETGGHGHLYRVSLPDEDTRYLFWDQRLAQQPTPIQHAALSFLSVQVSPQEDYDWGTFCSVRPNLRLSNANIEGRGDRFEVYSDAGAWTLRRSFATLPAAIKAAKGKIQQELLRQTGKLFYENLEWQLSGAKQASLALLAKDVYGIKYLDGISRPSKEGSYNYVLFDASHVVITEIE